MKLHISSTTLGGITGMMNGSQRTYCYLPTLEGQSEHETIDHRQWHSAPNAVPNFSRKPRKPVNTALMYYTEKNHCYHPQ